MSFRLEFNICSVCPFRILEIRILEGRTRWPVSASDGTCDGASAVVDVSDRSSVTVDGGEASDGGVSAGSGAGEGACGARWWRDLGTLLLVTQLAQAPGVPLSEAPRSMPLVLAPEILGIG